MISHKIIHIGLGRTGEATIRNLLHQKLASRIKWIDIGAHLTLDYSRSLAPDAPSFSFVRNPFDWYLSYWERDMKIHRWRGTFRDWFYKREKIPTTYKSMYEQFQYLGGFDIDYIGRFECLLDDLILILGKIIPDIVKGSEIKSLFPKFIAWSYGCSWIEGYEQWMREELYTQDMIDAIYSWDEPLFRQFGYSFEEKYYFPDGYGPSCHPGLKLGDWNSEKVLSDHWADWEGRGIYVRQLGQESRDISSS